MQEKSSNSAEKLVVKQEKSEEVFGYPRNIFYTGLTSFFTDTTSKLVSTVLPILLLSMGSSKVQIAVIEGLAEAIGAILKGISGWWSDRLGKNKPLMLAGYAVTALVTPIFGFTSRALEVLSLRLIERTAKGLRTAPRDSLIAASARDGKGGKAYGFHKAMDNAGAILGPLLASALLFAFPITNPERFKWIFLIAAVPALLGVSVLLFFVKEAKKQKEKTVSNEKFERKFAFLIGILILFSLANSSDALILIRALELGVGQATVPLFVTLLSTISVVLAVFFGKLSDRFGATRVILLSFGVYALAYTIFATASTVWGFSAAVLSYGLYNAIGQTPIKSLVVQIVAPSKRGQALGILHASQGLSVFAASFIAGKLYEDHGAFWAFGIGVVLSLMAAALLLLWNMHYNKGKI